MVIAMLSRLETSPQHDHATTLFVYVKMIFRFRVMTMKFNMFLLMFLIVIVSLVHLALAKEILRPDVHADYIVVEKAIRRMMLFSHDKVIRSYRIALGINPRGPKLVEGDHKTPEGRYLIDSRNENSGYHLSLHISYPNDIDREIAALAGVTSGGNIMIHGTSDAVEWMGKYHVMHDWTDGCIAVTNQEMEEIWRLVPDGTVIEIKP